MLDEHLLVQDASMQPEPFLALNELSDPGEQGKQAAAALNWTLDRGFLQFLATAKAASAAIWDSWLRNRNEQASRRGLKRTVDEFLDDELTGGQGSARQAYYVDQEALSTALNGVYDVPTTVDQLGLTLDTSACLSPYKRLRTSANPFASKPHLGSASVGHGRLRMPMMDEFGLSCVGQSLGQPSQLCYHGNPADTSGQK